MCCKMLSEPKFLLIGSMQFMVQNLSSKDFAHFFQRTNYCQQLTKLKEFFEIYMPLLTHYVEWQHLLPVVQLLRLFLFLDVHF